MLICFGIKTLSMIKKVVRIRQGRLYLTPHAYIDGSQILSPSGIKFKSNVDRLLEVDVEKEVDHLTFQITDYHSQNNRAF